MKKCSWVLLCMLAFSPLYSQYYLRGEIKDQRGRMLSGVQILLASKGQIPFYSGSGGTFGINTSTQNDTLTLLYEGYDTLVVPVNAHTYHTLLLKMQPYTLQLYAHKLLSATTNLRTADNSNVNVLGESYTKGEENSFVNAVPYPETGFAISTDKAAYSNLRRFLNNDMLVPADAIRLEEMLNYFDFSIPGNRADTADFHCRTQLANCPWNPSNQLLFINLSAPVLNLDNIPPSNLVFLIDVSGSMEKPNRLPLLQSAFSLLIKNLRAIDTITLVTYGGGVQIALPPTSGDEKEKIRNAIAELAANGNTPGADAIRLAYAQAKRSFMPNGNNRVILATDGDFNIGQTNEKELEDLILGFRKTGIYLTCLGVGMGNYKDSKLETLAKKGNGNFAYLDNVLEAQKVLVTEFTQTIYSVASNAFLKIRFDASVVKSYRLIGYDNKKDALADSSSKLEGGEIGSGHSLMAIFEVEPVTIDAASLLGLPLATISLHYQKPGTDQKIIIQFRTYFHPVNLLAADSCYRLATCIALFGSILKNSSFTSHYSLEELPSLVKTAINYHDPYQQEFLSLVEKALMLYKPVKKKKKK